MRDIWGFLLQTLTASGVAVLLLIVKRMFRDKLPPQWQFSIWGILGLVLLIPAGLSGRYVLINWPWLVETAKTVIAGDYGLTRVVAPIPMPPLAAPATAAQWLYCLYLAGVLALLARYVISYIRLRLALRRGRPAVPEQVNRVAEQYGLRACRAVEVPGLTSAFICGVFRPILVLPTGAAVDDKVILHELLHRKQRDTAWGLVICCFRCVHWCNPLLWYCADQASNDLEARCDQRVLELLEGEDRRDYGHILLSMANEKYARTPGTSSMANGGRNIRQRIEAIVRFKKYPSGMALASVCVAVALGAPLLLGTQAKSVYSGGCPLPDSLDNAAAMASARTVRCTTPAGALDTYGKALLEQNGAYRAMCAPLDQQAAIGVEMQAKDNYPAWDAGLPCWPDTAEGYFLYYVEPVGEAAYEALIGVKLNYPPEGQAEKEGFVWLAYQTVRVERQEERWVVLPQEDFQTAETAGAMGWLYWGCDALSAYVYQGEAEGIRVEVRLQKGFQVDNTIQETNDMSWFMGPTTRFATVPKPNAVFDTVYWNRHVTCAYVGDEARKDEIRKLGVSTMHMEQGEERPKLHYAGGESSGSSSTGENWDSQRLEPGWGPEVSMGGGGSGKGFDKKGSFGLPDQYAADLYINGHKQAELTLLPVEGGAQ